MKLQLINKTIFSTIIIGALTLTSCKKDKQTGNKETTGSVKIELEHIWGAAATEFALEQPLINSITNDTLTFSTFKYYISNIQFKKSDGNWWSVPESYYLINVNDATSCLLKIDNVPTATYTEMRYTLGVDSTRNVSGAQTGALSTTNGMFWSWNSGYIMLKAEGTSPNSTTGDFALHFGGFKGANNIVTIKSTNFDGALLNINPSATPQIHLSANPAQLWQTLGSVKTTNKIMMPSAQAKQAASDFYNSIQFEHLHN